MIDICLTCSNNKAGRCVVLNHDIIPDFICDFYRLKRSGAFRRKRAKLNRGVDMVIIIKGEKYVIKGKKESKNGAAN